jgi:hypothetical protein
MSFTFSGWKNNRSMKPPAFTQVSCLASPSTLTSFDFQRTTGLFIPVISSVSRIFDEIENRISPHNHILMVINLWKLTYEVLTAVAMKSSVFWGITPFCLLKVNRCFGETCRLHLQSRIISRAGSKHIEVICSCKTSIDYQRTRRRYILED